MFVTYKASKVDGYTNVVKSGQTNGGGWYDSPAGGGFYNGPCGEQCLWNGGKSPPDTRVTLVGDYTISNGYCASSRSDNCARQGYCALNAGTGAGVADIKAPYATYTSFAKLFAKLTCLDGLTSTQTESENPYTKTAEQACTTSKNSGKDVGIAGALPTSTKDCYYVTPAGAISLYAGGPNFPAERDGEYKVTQTVYNGCGKAETYDDVIPKYKTKDPCPIYYEPDCESAYILSKPGSYIMGGKNVGPFSTTIVHALATNKAVEFSVVTGKESPKIDQTFSYSNKEVTLSNLKAKASTYTNSYIWIGESGASTSTYKVGAGGYEAGTAKTLFYSGEVKATAKGEVWETIGPGTNPCCNGSQCSTDEVSKATTDTLFAGSSFVFTHCVVSTTNVGAFLAYQPTTISRGDHLAWEQFSYSTEAGANYNSARQEAENFQCVSIELVATGGYRVDECYKCEGGMVPRDVLTAGPPENVTCGNLNCGCTSAAGGNTTKHGPGTLGKTNCYDPCVIATEECTSSWALTGHSSLDPMPDPITVYGCCDKFEVAYSENKKNIDNQIMRKGACAIVNIMKYDVAYTHLTCAQTLTTGIGNLGFHATLQKSEGLYFLDSKGSIQTATSFSLKQSKSDIALSHVNFAFSGAYYNPMGRTTQFGSDGAKKTFIALATGDAVYLVGSPDGKSKANSSTTSHDGDVHSYYISDPDAKSAWNQASWPGHGVVNGKITTGTFSFSFNTGAFANSYSGGGGVARFSLGVKQTIVADGGLNIISSKGNVSEKSFKTTYSTNAFSTSFDSTFKGAWIAKAIPYTYVATKSVGYDPNPYLGIETNHVISINCPGCDFPQAGVPYPLIGDSSAYFIKGAKSLIYLDNADTYLWTHPAFKKKWGDGHGANCEEE
jgi:hypothetical protein